MVPSKATIAAIRYGYGFSAAETPPSGADELLAQIPAGQSERALYMPEGADARRREGADLQFRSEAAGKAVKEGKAEPGTRDVLLSEIAGRLKADVIGRVAQAVQ